MILKFKKIIFHLYPSCLSDLLNSLLQLLNLSYLVFPLRSFYDFVFLLNAIKHPPWSLSMLIMFVLHY